MIPTLDRIRALQHGVIVYVIFYGITVLGRFFQPAGQVLYFLGIAFPVIWAASAKEWAAMGFTRRNWGRAVLLGALAGCLLFLAIYSGLWLTGTRPPASLLPRQLLLGIPLSFLVIAPFQEFLFRGWLQPRLQMALGNILGLLTCSLLFALWDTLPSLQDVEFGRIALTMITLLPASFGVGLIFGYLFHRTGNILAPWLAHALAVLAVIAAGRLLPV